MVFCPGLVKVTWASQSAKDLATLKSSRRSFIHRDFLRCVCFTPTFVRSFVRSSLPFCITKHKRDSMNFRVIRTLRIAYTFCLLLMNRSASAAANHSFGSGL